MKEIGIYIHIPFCKRKCYYCDFYSLCADEAKHKEYFDVLVNEIQDVGKTAKDILVKTIYIGGGTPSVVKSKYIALVLNEIKQNFNIDKDAEITIEVNPGTVTLEKLQEYISCGVNRLSIGMQAIQNNILKTIGRIHTCEEFLDCYNKAKEVRL